MPFIGQEPLTGAYHVLDAITTSATATYNLQLNSGAFSPATANQLLVSLNGVIQKPGSSFTISGSQITFSSTLSSSDSIDFIIALGDVLNVGTPTDGSVSTAKIAPSAVTDAKIAGMSSSKLTGALPALDGSALTGLSAVVRQVVHSSDTDGYSQTTSTSWSDAFSVNITPTAADSKLLVWFTGNLRSQRSGDQLLGLVRVGRTISGGSFVQLDASDSGYADNQNVRQHIRYINYPAAAAIVSDFAFMELDTPSTTSQITYQIQQQMQSSQAFQRIGGSSIIVMEIAP